MLRLLILLLSVFMYVKAESQQWIVDYPYSENEMVCFTGGDVSGEYNYSVGFRYDKDRDVYNPIALCFDSDGNYKDKSYHEIIHKGYFCYALGLGDGTAFVVARYGDDVKNDVYEKLWFAIIDTEMEIIREKRVEIEKPYITYGNTMHALKNDKNEIVVVSQIARHVSHEEDYNHSCDYVFYKMNMECDSLKCSYLKNTSLNSEISDFTTVPNTDRYAVFGNGMNGNNVESVFYIDGDLNYVSCDFIDDIDNYPNILRPKFMSVDHWLDENSFIMSLQSPIINGVSKWRPLVLKMDVDMKVIDMLSLDSFDKTNYVSQFRNMAYVDQGTIYISTFEYSDAINAAISNKATIYLINEDLELLGIKELEMKHYLNVLYVQPTLDKGCIIQGYIDDGERKQSVICKLTKSDFEISTYLNQKELLDMNVYPNPVSSLLNIDVLNVEDEIVKLRIFDMLGRRYLDKDVIVKNGILSIDVSLLTNGVYLCYMEYDERCCLKRIFIKE